MIIARSCRCPEHRVPDALDHVAMGAPLAARAVAGELRPVGGGPRDVASRWRSWRR